MEEEESAMARIRDQIEYRIWVRTDHLTTVFTILGMARYY